MDDRGDFRQQQEEEAYYFFTMAAFAEMVKIRGAKQVAHDLNEYYEGEFHVVIHPASEYLYIPKKKAA